MKLYEVTNGYMGFSYVRCLVIAESEEQAKDLARVKYKENDSYSETYWSDLKVQCLCKDTTQVYVGDIED